MSTSLIEQIPTSFATCSIGYAPSHTLPKKLDAIHQAGFQAIELSFPDLQGFAKEYLKRDVPEDDYEALCEAGKRVKELCAERKLHILMLQPFANFEGWPEGSEERKNAFERAKGWIRIMQAVGTDMLQVGSTDSDNIDTSPERIVEDLRQLADMLAIHKFRLAYENWCWSTHASTWRAVWDIVCRVDRPNVGLCLDTFQTAGSEWADPTTTSGLIEDVPRNELERRFRASLGDLAREVPAEKIYLLQISDAYKPAKPLSKAFDEEKRLRPRRVWSHDFRPIPFAGGYLPVVDVTKAVLATGFRGYFSIEVFDSGAAGTVKEYDLDDFARKAMESHRKLLEACAGGADGMQAWV
ncbi:xylose isomerase-like protein [Schizophyllum commune H4-8]|uniref:Xylose isomerase-like TIM barrel domain-containing protein n=1 Tax=Schizophyllum commune (strain H4-8 / FGSC 9210) TaxID=578458 RepID=D8Q4I3_SCHCM|nr:xylose isomerase-like protein [Schizophyllum commune H4-8]KAI5892604.1 xylose isomerase-like protein [Schizophyllum commune H4-8]